MRGPERLKDDDKPVYQPWRFRKWSQSNNSNHSCTIFTGVNQELMREMLRGKPSDNQMVQDDRVKQSPCSFSVYRNVLTSLKVRNVHCETLTHKRHSQQITGQLRNLELLNADVDEFMANETGWQRFRRYVTRDPNTLQYPGEYAHLVRDMIYAICFLPLTGLVLSIHNANKDFKRKNPYSYKDRRFEQNRMAYLLSNGVKTGLKFSLMAARILTPFSFISFGLIIFSNNTNPLPYGLGGAVTCALNHNLFGKTQGFHKTLSFGLVAGLTIGTVIYTYQNKHNTTQEILDRDIVKKKLYNECPSRYEA